MEEGKGLERVPGSGRPQEVDLEEVKNTFKENLCAKMSDVSKEIGVSKSSVSRAVQKVGGTSLRRVERLFLIDRMQEVFATKF